MAENPALKPTAEAVEGDNLTTVQAALLLACLESDPNATLKEAETLEMSPDDVDDLIGMLSEMAGEDDEATEGDEAPEEEEEVA